MRTGREMKDSKHHLPTSALFLDEMIGLFCGELEKDFLVIRKETDTVIVRHPLTNTRFMIRLDIRNSGTTCFHWHILDSNCKNPITAEQELSFDECVRYVRLHRYGRSMPAYYAYAV